MRVLSTASTAQQRAVAVGWQCRGSACCNAAVNRVQALEALPGLSGQPPLGRGRRSSRLLKTLPSPPSTPRRWITLQPRVSRRQRRAWRAAAGGGSGPLLPDDEPEQQGEGSAIPDTLPAVSADSDWRTFRAKLVAASSAAAAADAAAAPAPEGEAPWAHSLPGPEQGCLLLANPLMFATSQQYFHMSVILVFAHDERGSAGLIVNRPTDYTVGELSGAASLQPEMNACRLHLGGDVGEDSVHLLHGVPGLPSAPEVIPGLHLGGFEGAKKGLAEGRFTPDQFMVLTRYAGWGPGQLESECKRGVWLPVSANARAVLRSAAERRADVGLDGVAEMWHYIAKLCGGDLAALSKEVRGVPDPDISRAAGGGLQQEETEESEEGPGASGGEAPGGSPAGGGGGGDPSQLHRTQQARWQQHRRRTRLPEPDYRDGAGI